jgi:hypothetical protein
MAGELMVINPVRSRKRYTAKRRSSTRKRRRVSYARRNPIAVASASSVRRSKRRRSFRRSIAKARSGYRNARSSSFGSFIGDKLLPAAIGAGGAFALDMAWDRLPIPAQFKTGMAAPVVRIAGAVGIGLAAGMVGGKKFGDEAMAGALTVTIYDLLKAQMAPSVPATPTTVSAYVRGLGYPTAARSAGYMGRYVNS